MVTSKKRHWFVSSTGQWFYAVKIMNYWRFIGPKTGIIKETPKLAAMKKYVESVFGFDYMGYM